MANDKWRQRKRPLCLERRYQFDNYDALRDFLDRAAELSERENYYPDIGFGRDYVNITIHAEEGADDLTSQQRAFAQQLEDLADDSAD